MKVLFAVSSENISEAIIKRYQKEYKEILSYKNVYYFNAILKEIQKDKTYDRIIISEDLEPFANNNYDTVDKFIFEKLDSISDEAEDSGGKETSIILICSDRRQKGNAILVKLFGIGVYNALIGSDRSMEEVCKLIKRPRTKKEAKLYYRIDADDVNYKSENENEVSEVEIQNILVHFKKLGKNTAKYSESFNNIAVQYNNEQLKIIVNCLPINVKAVLEAECEKYQELMSVTGGITSVRNMMPTTGDIESAVKKEFSSRNIGQSGNIGKPIVIPSAVRNAKNKAQVLKKPVESISTQGTNTKKVISQKSIQGNNIARPTINNTQTGQSNNSVTQPVQARRPIQSQQIRQPEQARQTQQIRQEPQVRPPVQPSQSVQVQETTQVEQPVLNQRSGFQRQRRQVPNIPNSQNVINKSTQEQFSASDDELLEDNLLPGLDENVAAPNEVIQSAEVPTNNNGDNLDIDFKEFEATDTILPQDNFEDVYENEEDSISRRGRGRPRKTPVEGAILKPKGKRGRPRKYAESEEMVDDSTILPGIDLEDDITYDAIEDSNIIEDRDEEIVDEGTMLPGFDYENESDNIDDGEYVEGETILPGMGFDDQLEENDDFIIPDSEEYIEEDLIPEEYVEELPNDEIEENLLPEEEYIEEDSNLGNESYIEDGEEEYTDEVSLPGLDDLDDIDDSIQSDYEEDYSDDDAELLPGVDSVDSNYYDDSSNIDGTLPGMDSDFSEDFEEENLIPGFNNSIEDDGLLPGINNSQGGIQNANSGNVESIKPRVDYSMSSLNSLITKDKKIAAFIGTSKNGVSFLVNNLGALFSSLGINTAILDMTRNKNSYYIYTKNEEELRNIAYNSIEKLQNGYAEGIRVDKNLTVYTSLPNDNKDYSNAEPILSTLIQSHSLVLIDCDYDTDLSYFASCQELYLVQSMDILTIQPLTAFLRELKTNGILEPEKIRVIINKELKVKSLSIKAIIGGLSYYNDPAMSFMTELFNKDMVKACTIPFEENAYSKYLEGIVNCSISVNGLSRNFMMKLKMLGDMVYPLTSSKQTYGKGPQMPNYTQNAFSNSMNDTLNKMRKKY